MFGVSFLVLSPEHELVSSLTTSQMQNEVDNYLSISKLKSERERQSDKKVSGVFTGGYAIHPFSKNKIEIWVADYVLASYGTGAVMAVPCGDQRDWLFAKHYNINIINIFKETDISQSAFEEKDAIIINSDFLNNLNCKEAIEKSILKIEDQGIGTSKVNYRLRDAVFLGKDIGENHSLFIIKMIYPTLFHKMNLLLCLRLTSTYLQKRVTLH